MTRPLRIGALLALIALPLGCEIGTGGVVPAPGVGRVDSPDASSVGLVWSEPTRKYRVVGRVRSQADARIESRVPQARAAAEDALRRQGAAVGADAVLVDEALVAEIEGGAAPTPGSSDATTNLQRPGGDAYATRPVHRVLLRGRAVCWLMPETPPADPAP